MIKSDDVAIVGNGASLVGAGLGKVIDAHDAVVRLKNWSVMAVERPADLGKKCSATLVSNRLAGRKINHGGGEWWVFVDSRTGEEELKTLSFPSGVVADIPLCRSFVEDYDRLRENYTPQRGQVRHHLCSDKRGHKHPSAGSFAIAYTLHLVAPGKLTLYGFDNVISGKHSRSLSRPDDHHRYPDHNWPAEKRLLALLCDRYGYAYEETGGIAYMEKTTRD